MAPVWVIVPLRRQSLTLEEAPKAEPLICKAVLVSNETQPCRAEFQKQASLDVKLASKAHTVPLGNMVPSPYALVQLKQVLTTGSQIREGTLQEECTATGESRHRRLLDRPREGTQ